MTGRAGRGCARVVTLPLIVALGVVALPRSAAACAGCRNPNLPITRLATAQLAPRELRLSAIASATSMNVVHEAGCRDLASCAEVPAQPRFLHDQDIIPGELRAVTELGLGRTWGIEAQLPFRVTRTSIRYTALDGTPYQPLDPDIHHRDETRAGLGDPWLLGRWGEHVGGFMLTARAGLAIPLGRTEADPFALGAAGLRHQHIQFGSGTFDPVLMIDVSKNVRGVDVSAYGQTQLTLYENAKGFRAGNRFFTGVQAGRLTLQRITVALGLDVLSERPERWGGKVQQDGNLGRTELLGGISLTRPFGATIASLMARFPIYRHVVTGDEPPGTLSAPLMLSLVVSRSFRPAAP